MNGSLNSIELRRYTTVANMRDMLTSLFEREFIDSQIECGAMPIGQFNDLDDPNMFVWLRGFESMASRLTALTAFYIGSPVWKAHRDAANATLVDSDNVLLLRPARPHSGFELSGLTRANAGTERTRAAVAVLVLMLEAPADEAFVLAFEATVLPHLREHGERIAYFVSEEQPNDFTRLPVRDDAAFVVAGVCRTRDDLGAWHGIVKTHLERAMRDRIRGTELLRLEPLTRSLYR